LWTLIAEFVRVVSVRADFLCCQTYQSIHYWMTNKSYRFKGLGCTILCKTAPIWHGVDPMAAALYEALQRLVLATAKIHNLYTERESEELLL
jgi:hypothetical protein